MTTVQTKVLMPEKKKKVTLAQVILVTIIMLFGADLRAADHQRSQRVPKLQIRHSTGRRGLFAG